MSTLSASMDSFKTMPVYGANVTVTPGMFKDSMYSCALVLNVTVSPIVLAPAPGIEPSKLDEIERRLLYVASLLIKDVKNKL